MDFQNNTSLQNGIRRVLARKYRPKFLKDLIGQNELVQSLTKGIQERRIPQAILLHGIRGTGKTSTARILARSINCVGKDCNGDMTVTPCCECRSCRAVDDDNHVDVIEMDAASHTGVDDIREVIDSARYKAIIGRYKVFIIDEVHMLSKSAFNALLKTLEEPPAHVLFIFATTEINKIPETILSRCARFDFKRVDSKTLINHLKNIAQNEEYEIENDACAILARLAEGSVRDSLTLLDQSMNLTDSTGSKIITAKIIQTMAGFSDKQKLFNILTNILEKNEENVISEVRELLCKGADPQMIMQDLLECLYQAACLKIIPKLSADESIPEFERNSADAIAKKANEMQLLSLWKVMLKNYSNLKNAPLAGQALEMGLLRTCFAAQLPSIEQLIGERENNESTLNKNSIAVKDLNEYPSFEQVQQSKLEEPTSTFQDCSQKAEILTEQDLLALLEKNREALLISYINNDIAFISFKPGNICLQLRNEKAAKIISTLKQFLASQTGESWKIEIVKDSQVTAQTNEEKRLEFLKKEKGRALETPIVKKVIEFFPHAKVEFE
ncbi:MAG: DNA polymerase III subunit gamma/tau [Holosporales bacterium]|jgi:DNA polymerase-3 subunit gamma/tau|nr:DNA polymerase III subunit gamma/tau [Holosporales bacterium]